jgi:hypothetical protein
MVNFNDLPTELKSIVYTYLNQEKVINEMSETIKFLQNKIQHLRSVNTRLTLQTIQQLSDIQNLEFIMANGEDILPVNRRLNFEYISEDSEWDSDETIIEEV